MMTYEKFKEDVINKFMEYMPEEYHDYHIECFPYTKINRSLDGIVIKKEDSIVSPQLYVNEMYSIYQEIGDFEETIRMMCKTAVKELKHIKKIDLKDPFENSENRIVFQLINTEKNKDLLKDIPHRDFLDLSIIYVLSFYIERRGQASLKVTNQTAKSYGWDEEQLFQMAMENTKTIFPLEIMRSNDIILQLAIEEGIPKPIAETMLYEPEEAKNLMWILTNKERLNGCTALLYEDEIHKLSEKLECDLYLLPSSRHKIIAVPSKIATPEYLTEMVQEVNESVVDEKDYLSDSVYHYNKTSRTLSLFKKYIKEDTYDL